MAKKKILENKMDSNESISSFSDSIASLCKEINKKISDGDDSGAYLLGRGESPTEIPFFISTGSTILDTIIANKEDGGIPVGRVTEIYGEPSCVTEDTIVNIEENNKVQIKEIENLLQQGKEVKVKSKNGIYVPVKEYVHKGIMKTWKVILSNNTEQKVAEKHIFFTNQGWLKTLELVPNETEILFEDNKFYKVKSVNYIGEHKIVDIMIDEENFDDQCYFGNGMLNHNTGKSLLANHILANTQKMGGLAVLIDTESATSPEFLKAIGVDLKNLIWINVKTVEKVFETIETIIGKLENLKPKFVTIVWDSLAATSDEHEMESEYEAQGYGMNKAKMLSKGFRKITQFIASKKIALVVTNQVRSNIGVLFGEKTQTPGGWALPFYASLRIKVSRNGYLKEKIEKNGKTIEEIRGVSAKVTVKKSRIAPPFRECTFSIYFDRGIDDKDSWLEALLNRDVITRPTTQKYLLKMGEEREFEFKKAQWKSIVRDNKLDDEIKKLIIDSHIIKYDSLDSDEEQFPDDVDIVEKDEEKSFEQDVYIEKGE